MGWAPEYPGVLESPAMGALRPGVRFDRFVERGDVDKVGHADKRAVGETDSGSPLAFTV